MDPGEGRRGGGDAPRSRPSWLDALARRIVAVHEAAPGTEPTELAAVIEAFLAECRAGPERVRFDWPVVAIDSVDALAAALELSDGQLAWLADVRGLERTVTIEKLRNYRYAAVPRRSGLPRVIEAPKLRRSGARSCCDGSRRSIGAPSC
ncbi:MAG TPA: hypothetical protein VE571_13365 [Solirubrobacteraceae bacterium]|nr:hypothetical protein [Solirubrobacteraceae bacterium]